MKQLDDLKGIIAGVQAELDAIALKTEDDDLAVDLGDLSEKLDEALSLACAADVHADSDAYERAVAAVADTEKGQ